MSQFDKQIRTRQKNNQAHLDRAVQSIAAAVNREEYHSRGTQLEDIESQVLYELCEYFHLPCKKIPETASGIEEKMNFLLESGGVMRRHITLTGQWWKNMNGPVLARLRESGEFVCLIQNRCNQYYYLDFEKNKKVKINKKTAKCIEMDAVCFYRPLPGEKLSPVDVMKYALSCPSMFDWIWVLISVFLITLLGMVTPRVTQMLFSFVIPAGSNLRLLTTAVLLLTMALGIFLISIFQNIFNARITQKVSSGLYSASFARLLSMPTTFFKPYGSGELSKRLEAMQNLGISMMSILLNGGLTTIFSVMYVFQIFRIAPTMLLPAILAIALQFVVSILLIFTQRDLKKHLLETDTKLSGKVYSIIKGIQKIKLAGAENRAFHYWSDSYKEKASYQFSPPKRLMLLTALSPVASIFGTIIIYYAGATNLELSVYLAFQSAYSMTASALLGLTSLAGQLAGIKPILDLAKPLLETKPEIIGHREHVEELQGRIDISNLSFRYREDGPWIIDGMNLSIKPGEYLAIVGTTGCGKSTLLRLLLGFEQPECGSIFYDGKDVAGLDIRSLRRKIGTVLQDGKLFGSSIFGNIMICSGNPTEEAAWEAAEIAQIADDIRNMPMGMYTDMSGGGVSGGQRQRILIARAVASKPKILIFDEATSALDNMTQAKISQTLDSMECTRIVVAHRLSTIQNCDRILVLDHGKIVEEGTYSELYEKKGVFADLVARQTMEGV